MQQTRKLKTKLFKKAYRDSQALKVRLHKEITEHKLGYECNTY